MLREVVPQFLKHRMQPNAFVRRVYDDDDDTPQADDNEPVVRGDLPKLFDGLGCEVARSERQLKRDINDRISDLEDRIKERLDEFEQRISDLGGLVG